MTGTDVTRTVIEVTVEPYDGPAAQALAAALTADLDVRYAEFGGADGDDPETAALWDVRPEQVTPRRACSWSPGSTASPSAAGPSAR